MDSKELQEYIKTAISLETDIATQERIVSVYKQNSQDRKPTLKLQNEPDKPSVGISEEYHPVFFSNSNFDGAAACIFIGVFLILIGFFFYSGNLVDEAKRIGYGFQITGVLLFIPYFLKKKKSRKLQEQQEATNQRRLRDYEERLAKVRENNQLTRKQYQNNLSAWSLDDEQNIKVLTQHISDTRLLLEKLYAMDIIYNKYRNLPALTSIYEYLITERCDDLKGPHGAYNLYEDEVRKDTVISQLNTVIENLEQIKQNQFMLYQQVRAIQIETANVETEMKRISGYTFNIAQLSALNTYYNALTARNSEVTMMYHLLA